MVEQSLQIPEVSSSNPISDIIEPFSTTGKIEKTKGKEKEAGNRPSLKNNSQR